MNAFAAVSPQELVAAPEPRVRTCPYCYQAEQQAAMAERRLFLRANTKHPLSDAWICEGCGNKVVCHHESEPCPKCSEPAPTQYLGNRKKIYCPCRFAPEEQEAIAIREVANERARAIEQRKAAEEDLERAATRRRAEADKVKADACWAGRRQDCKLPRSNLLPFCGQCARFK